MIRFKTTRLTVAVAVAATLIVALGGLATASNMGFKLNKQLFPFVTGVSGDNWIALPYNSPYGTWADLCTQTGLRPGATTGALITHIDQNNNVATNLRCGTTQANVAIPSDGRGFRVRQTAPVPAPFIVVGSHNTGRLIDIKKFCSNPAAAGCAGTPTTGQGNFWFAYPYHTTAVTIADLCTSMGLTPGATTGALITRINPATNGATNVRCGTSGATTANLVLGEAIRIREQNQRIGIRPAHF